MKKHFYLIFSMLLISWASYSQSWTVYDGSVTPDLATPAWSVSNANSSADVTWTVQDDADISGNKVLAFSSPTSGQGGMWKSAPFDTPPTKCTYVTRFKQNTNVLDRVVDIDIDLGGRRETFNIKSDNTVGFQRAASSIDLNGTLDVTQWNVLRITFDASSGTDVAIKLYLNEGVEPIHSFTSTVAGTNSYVRYGDGNGTPTYSAIFDFVTYDVTGAYSPSESPLPDGLLPKETPATTWTVYDGSVTPDLATPAWAVSNATSSADVTWTVQDDADVSGNKVLAFSSPTVGQSGMWRTAAFDTPPTKFTYVTRLKQNTNALDRLVDIDIDLGGRRETINVKSDNTIGFQRSTGSVDLNGSLDVTKWNVLRFTFDASSGTDVVIKVYLNEAIDAVHTFTSTFAGANSYVRFGDGNGNPTYSALFDFVAYDATGAFSPTEAPLPDGLVPDVVVEEPKEDEAYLSDLTSDAATVAGFSGSKFEYNIELAYGTTAVPVVAATTLYETATAVVTQAAALPGSATVLVTGKTGKTETYTINYTVAKNNDATLAAVTVDGKAVSDFDPLDFKYRVPIAYGSTTIPVVVVTLTDANATYELTDAAEVLGTAKVVVTAENGVAKNTYEFTFYYEVSSDASLSDLKVDGATIAGFDPATLTYNMEISTLEAPGIVVTTSHIRAIAFVSYPASLPGAAVVKVTAEDGTVQRYTINFTTTAVVTGLGSNQFKIYPNPVVNQLAVDGTENVTSMVIYNMNGQVLKSVMNHDLKSQISIDFSDLKSGIYLINMKFTDGSSGQYKIKK